MAQETSIERTSKVAHGLKVLWYHLDVFLHQGKAILKDVALAKSHQRQGNDAKMLESLVHAASKAKAIQRGGFHFARGWKSLLAYQLAVFDISAAEETVRRARDAKLKGAAEFNDMVTALARQIGTWRDCIDEAREALRQPQTYGSNPFALLIFIPSTVMGLEKNPSSARLRNGLRFVYSELIAACREAGIPIEIKGRLALHGTPSVPHGRQYIGYHTMDPSPRGLHIKVTDRPGCYSVDRNGYSGWSRFSQTPLADLHLEEVDQQLADQFMAQQQAQVIGGKISKYKQDASDEMLPPMYVFLALQTYADAVQQLARISMLAMLEEVATVCRARGIPLIVKRHPHCKSPEITQALRASLAAHKIQLSKASIHKLIAGSCAVCVVNSSVGAEALLYGKPVYVFGDAEYQHVCHRMRVAGDFETTFRPNVLPVSTDELTRYLYVLRKHYSIDVSDVHAAKQFIRRQVMEFAGDLKSVTE